MIKRLLSILAASLTAVAFAEPSDTHVMLRQSAVYALQLQNNELLRALLQAGVQINESVEMEQGYTLLQLAVIYNYPRAVNFLLDNGALPGSRDKSGDRPIDIAFTQGYTNVCLLLVKPAENERMVGGFPEGVLEEIVRPEFSKEPTFVTFNGTNAPAEVVDWLGRMWKDVRPGSQAELTQGDPGKAGHIQDKVSKEAGCSYSIVIKKTEVGYEWTVHSFHGPLAGFVQSGKLIKKYGWWIRMGMKGGMS